MDDGFAWIDRLISRTLAVLFLFGAAVVVLTLASIGVVALMRLVGLI